MVVNKKNNFTQQIKASIKMFPFYHDTYLYIYEFRVSDIISILFLNYSCIQQFVL